MTHLMIKTTYQQIRDNDLTEQKTIYAHHDNVNDVISFYDENGIKFLCVDIRHESNVLDAINRLYNPSKNLSKLDDGIEYANDNDLKKCGL